MPDFPGRRRLAVSSESPVFSGLHAAVVKVLDGRRAAAVNNSSGEKPSKAKFRQERFDHGLQDWMQTKSRTESEEASQEEVSPQTRKRPACTGWYSLGRPFCLWEDCRPKGSKLLMGTTAVRLEGPCPRGASGMRASRLQGPGLALCHLML